MRIKYYSKAASVASAAALIAQMYAVPAFAAIEGSASNSNTGYDSDNESLMVVSNTTTVVQENKSDIDNNVSLKLNTGYNSASKNTGDGGVISGDVFSGVTLKTEANTNVAEVMGCGDCDVEIDASNTKTGADSWNASKAIVEKNTEIFQSNKADVNNDVDVRANTGKNSAEKNTGSAMVTSGDITAGQVIINSVNRNLASVGGNTGTGGTSISVANHETGNDSDNVSYVETLFNNVISQDNFADIDNDVELDFNTGHNYASKNTGPAFLLSGDVLTGTGISTTANTNFLDFSGCCDVEFESANSKTGADSWNSSKAKILNAFEGFQTNKDYTDNDVDGDVNTGYNYTGANTSDPNKSGVIDAAVEVVTDNNQNIMGSAEMPDWDFDEMPEHGSMSLWMLLTGWWM